MVYSDGLVDREDLFQDICLQLWKSYPKVELVTQNIELKRKQDRLGKLFMALALVFAILLLVVVLKNVGFIVR